MSNFENGAALCSPLCKRGARGDFLLATVNPFEFNPPRPPFADRQAHKVIDSCGGSCHLTS